MEKFLREMLSNENNISSKRVLGTIGFICSIVFIALWSRDLIDMLLITSASLVGLETISGIFVPKAKK